MRTNFIKISLGLLLASLLTACAGSGGDVISNGLTDNNIAPSYEVNKKKACNPKKDKKCKQEQDDEENE